MPASPVDKLAGAVIASAGLIVMLRLPVAVLAGDSESVTVTEKLKVPAVVGVPEIVPEELNVKPGGRVDPVARAQVYGPVPPEAFKAVAG